MFRKAKNSATAHHFFYPFLIILAGIIVYSNSFHVPFIFDDEYSIRDNRVVHDIGNFIFSSKGYENNPRRFIGFLTFALNYRLGGLDVTGYHVVNLAIHLACALLVYGLVVLTFRTPLMNPQSSSLSPQSLPLSPQSSVLRNSNLIAFFSAALFVVHPIQTEAVTYIVQRLASLAALFYVASLYFYVRFRLIAEGRGPASGGAKGNFRYLFFYSISIISAVLAMKTKEIAFTLPFIIVIYELVFFGRGNLIKRTLWALPLLATVVIIPLSMLNVGQQLGKVLSDVNQVTAAGTSMTRWQYLITEFTVIVTYVRLLFFPAGQNLDYDYPVYRSFFYPQVMLSLLFLVTLFGLGIYLVLKTKDQGLRTEGNKARTEDRGLRTEWKGPKEEGPGLRTEVKGLSAKREDQNSVLTAQSSVLASQSSPLSPAFRLMGFGILWFFITLSVESSIIPITDVIYEHRAYLPSIGMIICTVTGAFLLIEKVRSPRYGRVIILMLALAIGVLSVATYLRNEVWGDSIRLWKDVVAKSPAKERAHYNLGRLYQSQKKFDEAIEQYRIAIGLKPDSAEEYNNLGVIYRDRNMPDKAIEQFMIASKLNPDLPEAHYNLGNIYKDRKMPEKAIKEFMTAVELRPDYVEAHLDLGGVFYQSRSMRGRALKEYLIAVKLKPDCAEAYNNLGVIYEDQKMPDKAIEYYLIAIKLKPDYIEAHSNLGELYYERGQKEKARRELTTILRIKPNDQNVRQLLNEISKSKS